MLAARSLQRGLDAGIPLVRALELTGEHAQSLPIKHAFAGVAAELKQGATIAAALHPYRGVLTDGFALAIVAGFSSGQTDRILTILVEEYDFRLQTRRAIVGQMTYPVLIVLTALYGIPIMQRLWLGEFNETFARELAIDGMLLVVYLGIALMIAGLAPARKAALIAMSVLWPTSLIVRRISAARLLNGLAMMLTAGYSNHESLSRANLYCGNPVVGWTVGREIGRVRNGKTLSDALAVWPLIPREHLPTLQMAEYSGRFEEGATACARQLLGAARHPIWVLVSTLEAILIVAVGIWIARGMLGT